MFCHSVVYVVILLYGYYYGMMDHSGIKMGAVWPWQPSSMFHDDHHRYVGKSLKLVFKASVAFKPW